MLKIIFLILSLSAYANSVSDFERERRIEQAKHCEKIKDRMYVYLLYQCSRLNIHPSHELECHSEVQKDIYLMIKYCKKQENPTYYERWIAK